MAKPVSPAQTGQSTSSFWLPFTTIGVVGMLLGATITYLALLPNLRPTNAATAPTAEAPPSDPSSHLPAPELTAGQAPAQAERTLGNFYYDHQNWPDAISHYEAALRQGNDDADIRTDLGNAYRFAHRPDDALAQYRRAQQMNPAHEFSLFNQGGLYLDDLKQPGQAIEIWNQYLTRFPTGRNVDTARQLIAQTQAGVTGLVLPPAMAAEKPSATEDLILQQINAGQSKTRKP
ncbi:MAG: tetratricopeptide repeat protein [Opitutae bacterium]